MDRNVMRDALRCAGIMLLLTLGACTTPAPATPPEPVRASPLPDEPPITPAAPIDIDRLDMLLEFGDRALKDGRLLTPIDDCAYDFYRAALVVAPNHPAAEHGLQRLAERYVGMAEQAAERGQFDTARSLLERALIVNPHLDSIAAAQAQIEIRSTAARQHIQLDAGQLSAHGDELAAQLKSLGARAKAADAWVIIRARNDAEGRWIYQQMANAPGTRRIRAELTLASPPGVDLLKLAPTTSAAPGE
jgi:tetratricopeptide (TPR) repeat protein